MIITESSNAAQQTMMASIRGEKRPSLQFCEFTPASAEYGAEYKFAKVIRITLRPNGKSDDYVIIGNMSYYHGPAMTQYDMKDFCRDMMEFANDSLLEIHSSVYTAELLYGISAAGQIISDMASGAYFGKIDGKDFEDLTDELAFDKLFRDMMQQLDAQIDVQNRTITFPCYSGVNATIEFF